MSVNDAALSERLEAEEQLIFIDRYCFAALVFAIPLVLSFLIVDYFFKNDSWMHFFQVRLSIIPVALGTYAMYKFKRIRDTYHTLPALIGILYFGVFHAYLVQASGFENSIYFVGIIIATVSFFTFLPWPPRLLAVIHVLNIGPYLLLLLSQGKPNLAALVPNLAFQFSIAFICTVAFFVTRTLRKKEIKLRMLLEQQTKIQAQVIEEKTQQGIYLEKLASQFSPQVIEAIRLGDVDLARRSRKEITCIFIDIENSTARASRIDYLDYVGLVSDFFSMATDVFLKHDVTIGTYLGDGVLGLTNAPKAHSQHAINALNACAEILSIHQARANYYRTSWRTNFNIRIGINTGYAYVGFYPNEKRGTYTALGEAVNLTARLCGLAAPNTICLQKGFLLKNADKMAHLKVESLGTHNQIKGFEGESFDLYTVRVPDVAAINEQNSSCPLCGGRVEQIISMGEVTLVRCTSCSYTDLIDDLAAKAA